MKKFVFVLIGMVFLVSIVFAASSSSIQSFSLGWNENSNQLTVKLICKGQPLVNVVLSNGMTKDFICSSMDFGEKTWLIGDLGSTTSLTATATIPAPCDSCTKTTSINFNSTNPVDGIGFYLILGIIFVVALVFGWIIWKFHEHPRS